MPNIHRGSGGVYLGSDLGPIVLNRRNSSLSPYYRVPLRGQLNLGKSLPIDQKCLKLLVFNRGWFPVNYQTLTDTAVQRWLPDSLGIASHKTEVLPDRLTSPPQAEALVPNARIRKASFLILIAAFTSRSW